LYALSVFLLGTSLGVSANYFIILPVISTALAFGFKGGLLAGFLGLPANLVIFGILGHPEFSPASKIIAEISGIVVGGTVGYLSDFFRRTVEEMELRKKSEESLKAALREKDFLYREMHHRVKNNLNVIKSIVRLQCTESSDPNFIDACSKLEQRIYSIAVIHERLFRNQGSAFVHSGDYVRSLIRNIAQANAKNDISPNVKSDIDNIELSEDMAIPLGLIINEVITNAFKHAFESVERPALSVLLKRNGNFMRLEIADNGPGIVVNDEGHGLGMKLVAALCRQLRGSIRVEQEEGTRVILEIPLHDSLTKC
jgi:two-component sensor histidine kinase